MQQTTGDRVEVKYNGETYVVDEDDLTKPDRPAYVETFVESYDEEALVGFNAPDTKGGSPFVDTQYSRISSDAFEGSGWYLSTIAHEPRSNDDALLRAFVRPTEDAYDLSENPFTHITSWEGLSVVPDEHIVIGHKLSDVFDNELHYLTGSEEIAILNVGNLSTDEVESVVSSNVDVSKSASHIYVQ